MRNAFGSLLSKNKIIKKSPLSPAFFKPQLAKLSEEVPSGKGWIFEDKFDGYRLILVKAGTELRLITRGGLDWTKRFPSIAKAAAKIRHQSIILDGEIVAFDKKHLTSLSALQKCLSEGRDGAFVYYVFDVLYADGYDVSGAPLSDRKKILESVLGKVDKGSPLQLTTFRLMDGKSFFEHQCQKKAEGIIAKKVTAPYVHSRSPTWLKIKCHNEDEFVIGAYTDPRASRKYFGSLLLGYYDSSKNLVYAGKVGTGFDAKLLEVLFKKFRKIESATNPFTTNLNAREKHSAHFLKPLLVAQISYTEWTDEKHLRHPVFLGLREDKPAKSVVSPGAEALRNGVENG